MPYVPIPFRLSGEPHVYSGPIPPWFKRPFTLFDDMERRRLAWLRAARTEREYWALYVRFHPHDGVPARIIP